MLTQCCTNCSKLEDKITELEYELTELKASIGLSFNLVDIFIKQYELTRHEAKYLNLFYTSNRVLSHEFLDTNTSDTRRKPIHKLARTTDMLGSTKVLVHRIRKKLEPEMNCKVIENVWGQGYKITKEAYDYIKADLEMLKGESTDA